MDKRNTEIKQYLLSLIGHSPYGVIAIDFTGVISIISGTAIELFGLDKNVDHYLDKTLQSVLPEITELNAEIESCIANGRQNFDIECVVVQDRYLSLKGRKIINGMMVTINDETEIHTARNALLKRTTELEATNRELEQFVYISSHDLQESVKTIIGYASLTKEMLNQPEQLPNAQQYLDVISNAAQRVSTQIKSLNDYSRIGENVEKETVDLNLLINESLEPLQNDIKERNICLKVGKLPVISVYKNEFRKLLLNIISNAIKFTRNSSKPSVEISAIFKEQCWQFDVVDNGIGIDKKDVKRIFIIFQRLHNKPEFPGLGIGLAYCKRVIDMHGGKIWVVSEPGAGSCFSFSVPV